MASRSEELGEFLAHLKQRSGRSYHWIGSRVNASKSTVQRYCTGHSVPHEFGIVERIARQCGATGEDIEKLFRLWARATSEAADTPGAAADRDRTGPVGGADHAAGSPGAAVADPGPPAPAAGRAVPGAAASAAGPPSPPPLSPPLSPPPLPPAAGVAVGTAASAATEPRAAGTDPTDTAAGPAMPGLVPGPVPGSAPAHIRHIDGNPAEEGPAAPGPVPGSVPAHIRHAGGNSADGGPAAPAPLAPVSSSRLAGLAHLWRLSRRRAALVSVGLAAVVGLSGSTVSTSAPSPAGSSSPTARPAPQWITGPAWTRPPAPVPSTLFGVTINSATGTMPAFRVGAVRLWDSGTRWSEIQHDRGTFDWSVLDRHVAGAERAGLPALFVFGGTPRWASPAGPPAPYPDGSRAAPPDDLADWDTFVRAVVGRYSGRIESYELWVLANDRRFYNGSVETLVEMTRRASQLIRAADPSATVVCPGMGNLWTTEGQQVLRRFGELGGYDYCDVAGIKLYQRTASDPPETMLELATATDRVLHETGIHPRLWSTGTTYSIPLQGSLDETTARNYAVRFFLVGVYARNLNLERMYFYNWGGTRIPLVLQADGGAPTRAALAVEQLQRWLADARSRSCGRGLAINLPDNVWQCEFTVTEPDRSYDAVVRWTYTGTATTTAGPGVRAVHTLDGDTIPTRSGDTITVTEEPILIEYGPREAPGRR